MLIRHVDVAEDAAACAAIYAPFVTDGAVSFEEVAPTPAALAERIADYTERYPWLVAEREDAIAGFAYATTHRARAAYRWTVEVSVYVHPGHRRAGVGRALYGTLLPLLREQGLALAIAGITLPNDASIALHEAFGFEHVGVYRGIGFKAGAWRDVGFWQCRLSEPRVGAPPEPTPPTRRAGPL
jgi:phosphinothricin acetyltransferase